MKTIHHSNQCQLIFGGALQVAAPRPSQQKGYGILEAKPENKTSSGWRKGPRIYFTNVLEKSGVSEGRDFAACTDAVYESTLGMNSSQIEKCRGVDSAIDGLTDQEVCLVSMVYLRSSFDIVENKCFGLDQCLEQIWKSSRKIASVDSYQSSTIH